jgi:hypothetical protein
MIGAGFRQEHGHEQDLLDHIVQNLIEAENAAFATVPAAANSLENRLRDGPVYSALNVRLRTQVATEPLPPFPVAQAS